jgi:DoxX-like family
MTPVYLMANALSVGVFLYFGTVCLVADGMREDFERFGMSHLRRLTGVLEVLGGLGLVAGLFFLELAIVSAGGLALLMLLGLLARVRQGDSTAQMLPAALLVILNLFIAWRATAVIV